MSQLMPLPTPMRRMASIALAPVVLALGLGGCVSLLPKDKPVQLYRIAASAAAPAAPVRAGLLVTRGGTAFTPEAAGDRLLTVTGQEAAYIADARWFEPASLMFEAALTSAFEAPGSPRLAGRGEGVAGAPVTLRLEVRRFQADYDHGQGAAPTVEVTVHASLVRNADRTLVADTLIEARQPADDNRVTAIVAAYNAAVAQATGQVRDWTAANASRVAP